MPRQRVTPIKKAAMVDVRCGGADADGGPRKRRQRRAEVLDSDDDEEGSSSSSSSHDVANNNYDVRSSVSQSSSAVTMITHNTRRGSEEVETIDGSTSDDDDDDELMNPYVMNPFNGGNSPLDYSSQALLPPSMTVEMAPMTTRRGEEQQHRLRTEGGSAQPSSPRGRRREDATLAGFDPYGPDDGGHSPRRELEMEESIEFASPSRNSGGGGRADDWSAFDPPIDGPAEEFPSSFSPFPKPRLPEGYVTGGEGAPLGGTSAAFARGRPSVRSSAPGIARALADLLTAAASSAARALSLARGVGTDNPFSGGPRGRRRRRGALPRLRLLAVALAALFCAGTMMAVRNAPDAGEAGTTVEDKYGMFEGVGEAGRRPAVLKKMRRAKKHWWNRKGAESDAAGSGRRRPHVEVYQNGEKKAVAEAAETVEVPGDAEMEVPLPQQPLHQMDASHRQPPGSASKEEAPLPAVVVHTEEDGTILIRLPPTNADAPRSKMVPPPLGSAAPEVKMIPPPLGSAPDGDGDETVYIRLPYPQQGERRHRTLTELEGGRRELEPPPRGAAVLTRRPPPPLSESRHGGEEGEHRHGALRALRDEFESWMSRHGKEYGSHGETERRFDAWRKNHFRIKQKNEKHGPCRMTGKAVFGHNLFSDLDPGEFQSKFLTGYRGPRHHDHQHDHRKKKTKKVGVDSKSHSYFRENREAPPPPATVKRHPTIQRKLEENASMYGGGAGIGKSNLNGSKYQSSLANGCQWWDVSCLLRWVFSYQYIGGTREPVYDESSYPSALDWRTMGAVTDVHSQGSCGACWAITAVETIESANAIATGQLIDLDEEEVIACDGTCEMCNGGWPQNAYEYVMKQGGLPAASGDYDADWLYTVTAVLAGESYEASEYDMGSYFAATCPAGAREGGEEGSGSAKSGSGDNNGYDFGGSYVETTRYGKVKGYGYATDRCICYTDGSGCDCDDQDEKTAVLNVASYGPAAVCLEASLWQDYEGGIMTEDIGCSKSFLDMNHCVEVVGYAFTDGSDSNENGEEGEGNNNGSDSGSGSNDRGGGSRDDQREGYWIVKNQWSNYWGMNGYAYIAMGANTCGILNDMTQVYMN